MPGSIVNIGLIKKETSISVIGVFQQAYADITFNINHSFSLYLCENPCRKLTQEQLCLFKGFFELMEKLYNQTDHCFRQQIIKNCVQCLFWDMYAEVHNRLRADVSSNRQEVLYKQFIQLVQKNCHVQREISFYAERLHITSRYLLKIIQNIGNCTPKSIIDQYVTLEIKALLKSSDYSIKEIASRLCFPDQSYLGRFFKKNTNMSPSEYRTSILNTEKK